MNLLILVCDQCDKVLIINLLNFVETFEPELWCGAFDHLESLAFEVNDDDVARCILFFTAIDRKSMIVENRHSRVELLGEGIECFDDNNPFFAFFNV